MDSARRSSIPALLVALAALALNQWLASRWLATISPEAMSPAQFAYMLGRVAIWLALAVWLARRIAGTTRGDVVRALLAVGFVEQVGFRGAAFWLVPTADPRPPIGELLFGLAFGYVVFTPIVVVVALGGFELAATLRRRRAARDG